MNKRQQRNLFLFGVVIVIVAILWCVWQTPEPWRPWIVLFFFVVVPLILAIAHIVDRWQARQIERLKATKGQTPRATKPQACRRGRPARSSYKVRNVADGRAKQRML